MQVSVETTTGLERKLVIDIPAATVEQEITKRLTQVSRTARIDGFRAGKVPMRVIKQRYGKGVRQEVLGEQMQQSFVQAVTQEKLNPAGAPHVQPVLDEEGKDFQFTATFEIYPEVELVGLEEIEVEKLSAEVTESDVVKMLDVLKKQQATYSESKEPAKDGDRVKIDFEGFIDGEAFEGGSAEGHDLVLGSRSMISGFEDQLIGTTKGEEKTISVKFPDDYQSDELKGKDAEFKIVVHAIESSELPVMNEEFFKKYGVEAKNEEEFRVEIQKNMERELKQASSRHTKSQTLDGLLGQNNIDVPSALVDQEIGRMQQEAVQQFGGQNVKADMLPRELFSDRAERRVKLGLLINAVIDQNNIKADEAKVDALIDDMASTYQDPDQVKEYYKANKEQRAQLEALAVEEQVVDMLLEKAKVSETVSSYEDVVKAANVAQQ